MGFPGSILLGQGDIYKQTSDKRHPLGTRGYTRDGRAFRYSQAGGTNLSVGLLMQAAAPVANHRQNLTFAVAPTTNSSSIVVHITSAKTSLSTKNSYQDGYMFVNDGTGEGQLVQIKSHEIGGSTATTTTAARCSTISLHEMDKFTAAPTTASELGLVKNPYKDVIVSPTTMTNVALGVTPRAVTLAYYFWLQTWGPAPIKTDVNVTVGEAVRAEASTAGSVWGSTHIAKAASSFSSTGVIDFHAPDIGYVMGVGADAETSLVWLTLAI